MILVLSCNQGGYIAGTRQRVLTALNLRPLTWKRQRVADDMLFHRRQRLGRSLIVTLVLLALVVDESLAQIHSVVPTQGGQTGGVDVVAPFSTATMYSGKMMMAPQSGVLSLGGINQLGMPKVDVHNQLELPKKGIVDQRAQASEVRISLRF